MAYPYPITPGFPNNSTTGQFGIERARVFIYGGVQFTFLGPYPNAPYTYEGPLNAFKSADNGVTWAIVDALGSPTVMNRDDLSEPGSREAILKAGSTSVVLIPYVKWLNLLPGDRGGEMCFVEFDMATETWGTPVEGGPRVLPTDVSDQPSCLVIGQYCPTTDKYVFVFNARWGAMLPAPYSHRPVWSDIVECSGAGVWGVPATFAGGGADTFNSVVRGVVADPDSEKLHWIWITQQWGSTAVQYSKMYHTLYTPSTSTLGAAELIDTGTGAYGEANAGIGVYGPAVSFGACVQPPILTRSGHIVVPFVKDQPVPDQLSEPYGPSMVIAELEDSPTWTEYPVTAVLGDQITTGPLASGGWQLIDAGAGRIRGYWSNPAGSNGFVIQVADFSLITNSWSAPDVAYTHPDADFGDELSANKDLTPVLPVWYEATPMGAGSIQFWGDIALSLYGNIMLLANYYDVAKPGSGRMWLSTDYGATWAETQPAGNVDREWYVAAVSLSGAVRVAGAIDSETPGTGKLYVYTGGAWGEVVPEIIRPLQDWASAVLTPSGSTILVGSYEIPPGDDSGYLYISTDTGTSWTKLEPKGVGVVGSWQGLAISDDGQTLLVGEMFAPGSSRLWLSTDGGASWAETQPAGATDQWWPALAMSRDGQTMYAGANGERLYKSVDGGGTWNEVQPAGNVDQNWWRVSMSRDKQTVIASTDLQRMWVSVDGGTTWAETQPAGNVNRVWWGTQVSGDGSVFGATIDNGLAYVSTPQEPKAFLLATETDGGSNRSMNFWEVQGGPAPPTPFDLIGTATVPSGASVEANGVVGLTSAVIIGPYTLPYWQSEYNNGAQFGPYPNAAGTKLFVFQMADWNADAPTFESQAGLTSTMAALVSSDNGVTWAEADAGSRPVMASLNNTLNVGDPAFPHAPLGQRGMSVVKHPTLDEVWAVYGGPGSDYWNYTVRAAVFNLGTETWTTESDSGYELQQQVQGTQPDPPGLTLWEDTASPYNITAAFNTVSGELVVLYDKYSPVTYGFGTPNTPLCGSRTYRTTFDGAVWGATAEIVPDAPDTNLLLTSKFVVGMCSSSNGRVNAVILYEQIIAGITNSTLMHFEADDGFGGSGIAFDVIDPAVDPVLNTWQYKAQSYSNYRVYDHVTYSPDTDQILVFGNYALIATGAETHNTYYAQPNNTAVWASVATPVSGVVDGFGVGEYLELASAYDSTNLMVLGTDNTNNCLQIAAWNGAGFGALQPFAVGIPVAQPRTIGAYYSGPTMGIGVTYADIDAKLVTGNTPQYLMFSGGAPPPPPAPPAWYVTPQPATPGGWPVWPPVFRVPNYYDKCLQRFKCHLQKYPMQDASRCVDMLELWSGNMVPRNCKEFWENFKIVTPVPGETLVGQFRVPTGYAGMLYGIHLGYTGTGFVESSGDIYWRVMIGNAWAAKGLGNVSVQLGTPGQCLQLTDYIKLKSNQLVQVWVNVLNTSGNIQVGLSRILATLQGWYYPQ